VHLFHFSENPDIGSFEPRQAPALSGERVVWAIDEAHAPLYYLPRECPRVTFWPLETSTPQDVERWFGHVSGRMVIAVETAWLDRIREARLYRYTFAAESFESLHDHGVHVSYRPLVPLAVEPVGDLLRELVDASVELRFCPSLVPPGRAIVQTTLHFSLIHMRNAQGWPPPELENRLGELRSK
jgi:hypothetical protein